MKEYSKLCKACSAILCVLARRAWTVMWKSVKSIRRTKSMILKGKLDDFFLFVQSFYRLKTKTSFNRQFSPKSPKIGKKSGQRVQNSPNKDQVASDLLWESINSVLRPTVGIHQFCPPSYCGNPFFTNLATNLLWESINSVLRPTVGIHQFCPPSYCGNPLEYIQQLSAFRFYWARSPK